MQVIRKKKSQGLYLKGGVGGKLQERRGIGIQVKDLSSLLSLSWVRGRKSKHVSQYCEENTLTISSLPAVEEVPRKARLKIPLKVWFLKLPWSSIIEILASPPAPLSFTQNLVMISFLTENNKGSACYKYVY